MGFLHFMCFWYTIHALFAWKRKKRYGNKQIHSIHGLPFHSYVQIQYMYMFILHCISSRRERKKERKKDAQKFCLERKNRKFLSLLSVALQSMSLFSIYLPRSKIQIPIPNPGDGSGLQLTRDLQQNTSPPPPSRRY